ncbi:MAG TPA: ACT domain-containing protein [Methanomassiliicoccales archaeon]|nr:ACT domain-containing protein [Methanomassiliicoccales archaeon]
MKEQPQKESIAERTRAYIDAHPSVKDCISKDLINYSSLARQIMKDLGIKNEEAVMIACRRYAVKLAKRDHEREILRILANSRLEVKTKICIVTAKNDWTVLQRLETVFQKLINEKAIMQIIQGAQAITVIADEKLKNEVINAVGRENILKVRQDLVEITVKSPERIVETSGVFAFLASNLAENNVNVVETVSCFTDSIFIVNEASMIYAYSILTKVIETAEQVEETVEE